MTNRYVLFVGRGKKWPQNQLADNDGNHVDSESYMCPFAVNQYILKYKLLNGNAAQLSSLPYRSELVHLKLACMPTKR